MYYYKYRFGNTLFSSRDMKRSCYLPQISPKQSKRPTSDMLYPRILHVTLIKTHVQWRQQEALEGQRDDDKAKKKAKEAARLFFVAPPLTPICGGFV